MNEPSFGERDAAGVPYPPAPEGLTLYMVGDVHGRLDLLVSVQQQIDADRARRRPGRSVEVYLGDYIDRGPHSAGVVSRLLGRAAQTEALFLRGNHEQILLDFLHGRDCLDDWMGVGGTATLLSYGIAPRLLARSLSPEAVRRHLAAALPPEHLRFYEKTAICARFGDYLAVHAGIRPGVDLDKQDPVDMLCIRREFLQFAGDLGCIVVHGHTPAMAPELRPNRINIDTGAFATNRLTSLRIDSDGVVIMPNAFLKK